MEQIQNALIKANELALLATTPENQKSFANAVRNGVVFES